MKARKKVFPKKQEFECQFYRCDEVGNYIMTFQELAKAINNKIDEIELRKSAFNKAVECKPSHEQTKIKTIKYDVFAEAKKIYNYLKTGK